MKYLHVVDLALHVVPGADAPQRARLVVLGHVAQCVRPDGPGNDRCLEAAVVQHDVCQHGDPDSVPGHAIGQTGSRGPGLSRASPRRPSRARTRLLRHAALLWSRSFLTAARKGRPRPCINCHPVTPVWPGVEVLISAGHPAVAAGGTPDAGPSPQGGLDAVRGARRQSARKPAAAAPSCLACDLG